MNGLTYYVSEKEYEPQKIDFWKTNAEMHPIETQDDLGFVIQSDDPASVRNPVLYLCGRKAILRLNRLSFCNVDVPDSFWPKVRKCANVDKLIIFQSQSSGIVSPVVKRVLHFPEFLSIVSESQEDDEPRDSGEDPGKWLLLYSRFTDRIQEAGMSVIYRHEKMRMLLAGGKRKLFLTIFFCRKETDWLADEADADDDHPRWASIEGFTESPLYLVETAAKYLRENSGIDVIPLVILDDDICIVNDEDVREPWRHTRCRVCYFSRSDSDFIPSLDQFLRSPGKEKMDDWEIERVKLALENYMPSGGKNDDFE